MLRKAVIRATGSAVPEKILTNADIEKMVQTSDEWIVQRTGIKERRVSSPEETASVLGTRAAKIALDQCGFDPLSIDHVICGTVTGDMFFPSTACIIQENIGANNAGAFDVGAACAGFIYSLSVGAAQIEAGHANRVLVIGVDVLTKYVDFTDRSTCVLFGDGAGCAILEGVEGTDRGVVSTVLFSDGTGGKYINFEVGGSRYPIRVPESFEHKTAIHMSGPETYKFAVNAMADACLKVLDKAGLSSNDIDLFVPHQANIRIIESAMAKLNLTPERVFINVHKYGNTSGGSIPLALDEAAKEGRLKEGMIVMTVGFGAGLVWGANIIRW